MTNINCYYFGHYDNPEKAQVIVNQYFSESVDNTESFIVALGDVISCNKKCDDLDLALDTMFSRSQFSDPPKSGRRGKCSTDEEKGLESVARKHYEERTIHNPLLIS